MELDISPRQKKDELEDFTKNLELGPNCKLKSISNYSILGDFNARM